MLSVCFPFVCSPHTPWSSPTFSHSLVVDNIILSNDISCCVLSLINSLLWKSLFLVLTFVCPVCTLWIDLFSHFLTRWRSTHQLSPIASFVVFVFPSHLLLTCMLYQLWCFLDQKDAALIAVLNRIRTENMETLFSRRMKTFSSVCFLFPSLGLRSPSITGNLSCPLSSSYQCDHYYVLFFILFLSFLCT